MSIVTKAQEQQLEQFLASEDFKKQVIAATKAAWTSEKIKFSLNGIDLVVPSLWYSEDSDLEHVFVLEKDEIANEMRSMLRAHARGLV